MNEVIYTRKSMKKATTRGQLLRGLTLDPGTADVAERESRKSGKVDGLGTVCADKKWREREVNTAKRTCTVCLRLAPLFPTVIVVVK